MFLRQKVLALHVQIRVLQVRIIWGVIVKQETLYVQFAGLENSLLANHPAVYNVLIPVLLVHILQIAINQLELAFVELVWLVPTVLRNLKLVISVQGLVTVAHMSVVIQILVKQYANQK